MSRKNKTCVHAKETECIEPDIKCESDITQK